MMVMVVPLRLRKRFTLYADDTGQPDIHPPADGERHTFAYGGVVVSNSGIANMQRRWRDIKAEFFATRNEVKAADFVRDDSPISYISDTLDRRTLAQGMLVVMMNALELRPVGCFVDKAKVPDLFVVKDDDGNVKLTKRGNRQLDKKWPFETVAMHFGVFLERQGARGRMVCDEPGQGKLEHWHARFAALRSEGPAAPQISRIDSVVFRRSHEEPGIELADVAVGLMRYAQERQEVIVDGLMDALRRAQAEGLGIMHVEA